MGLVDLELPEDEEEGEGRVDELRLIPNQTGKHLYSIGADDLIVRLDHQLDEVAKAGQRSTARQT